MTSPTLRRLCQAATLAHALPGAQAELRWPDGERRLVGSHPSCDVDPCTWRDAVVQSAATASILPHELLFGLAGPPAIDLLPGPSQLDLGGGVYRGMPDGNVIDLFVTTLEAPAIHDAVASCEAPGHARVGVRRDHLTGVTIVAVAHVEPPADGDGHLAWALAMACAVGEVSLTGA